MTRLLGAAVLSALATTGCLTSGLMHEASRPPVHTRRITGVAGAVLDGDRVIIGLTVRWPDTGRLENLDVEIPLRDLEWAHKNAVEARPQVPGLVFARPPRRALRKYFAGVVKGTPIEVEPIHLTGPGDLATLGTGLAPGIHVLSLQNFPDPGGRPHAIPVVLDSREDHEPYGIVIADLPEVRTHPQFLLLFLPLTVPLDVVTFPVQILLGVLFGGC